MIFEKECIRNVIQLSESRSASKTFNEIVSSALAGI
jgi:hypothetical protein